MEKLEALLDKGGIRKDIILLVISGMAVLASLSGFNPFPFDTAWIAIILSGVPIVLEAVIGLVTAFDIKADVLVSIALIASVCIGEDFAAGEVAFIMQLGGLLEEVTASRARSGIEKLVRLTPERARVISDGGEKVIASEDVRVGDTVRVLPGETVPVDGVIISGSTSINQAVMTGESLPVDRTVGDEVSSGTVNQFGAFDMKALKVGEDSSIRRMIRLVQSADASKAKIASLADRWATWIVVIALSASLITWFITHQIIRSVTILVVFCPCALVLATPTAIMAAIGNATKHGFLVKEGDALERLSSVSVVAFDKTGTLTYGKPEVVCVKSVSPLFSDDDIFRLTAESETLSEHPLGKAIVAGWRESGKGELSSSSGFRMIPGRGISATVEGRMVLAGSRELLLENGVPFVENAECLEYMDKGASITYVAVDGEECGFIALSDTLRSDSSATVRSLISLSVTPVLLTGDNRNAARNIASALSIESVRYSCLPEDKLRYIGEYQEKGKKVLMIGDGINDAPALKKADVSVAMGGSGSDIAVDAADIALVDDNVKEIGHLIALSRRMMTTIKLNMTFSMTLNFVAIVLAMTGTLNPVVGALVHNAGSVLVIINSALLLKWRKK